MKLKVPVLLFALIRNGLAMGQYFHSAAHRPQPNWKTGSITQYEAIARPSVLPSLTILLKKQDFPGCSTGHVAKTGNRPGSRGLAICSLPDFPAFAQAVRYGVPGTPSPPETMTGRVHTFGPRDGGAGRCVGRCDRRAQTAGLIALPRETMSRAAGGSFN